MNRLLDILDLPPIWLAGFAALGYALDATLPIGGYSLAAARPLALAVAGLSLGLAIWAAATMFRARTTIIPREAPSALVTSGPFRLSRNPIYLADLGLLGAYGLWLGSIWPILLAPAFAWVLTTRFIAGEEARLRAAYGDAFDAYARRVRRWL